MGIVVDDAGPDPDVRELVAGYADDRLTYVRNETNLGLAGNWNSCLRIAETDFVTLFHADDQLEPTYVALVLAGHQAHPARSRCTRKRGSWTRPASGSCPRPT